MDRLKNSRLIFIPQYPTPMRYSEWWIKEFPKHFEKYFKEVLTLNPGGFGSAPELGMFSPIDAAVEYELAQIKEFMGLQMGPEDVVLLADLSFPGFFSNILYHRRPKKTYAICHATSKNAYDYFAPVRRSKWGVETAHSKLYRKVFVASHYHKEKLGWDNLVVHPLPNPPFGTFTVNKKRNFISVARSGVQKITKSLEEKFERGTGQISREFFDDWHSYYKYISESRIMLITSKEEAYGYQVIDAILNNCTPIAPNRYSYPELLPEECLYSNYEDMGRKVLKALYKPPELSLPDGKRFYRFVVETIVKDLS